MEGTHGGTVSAAPRTAARLQGADAETLPASLRPIAQAVRRAVDYWHGTPSGGAVSGSQRMPATRSRCLMRPATIVTATGPTARPPANVPDTS